MTPDRGDGGSGAPRPPADSSPSSSPAAAGRTRTLIVTRDPVSGFGLTLSGDQPVSVQTVRPGGAADRAGVRENDIIVKVNGQMVVTDHAHSEVVKMIMGKPRPHQTCLPDI